MSGTSLVTARERALAVLGGEPDDTTLGRYLHGIAGVDAVGLEQRAASLATRSIKTSSKQWALDKIITLIDLTTLEGADTPGKVRHLCAKAVCPDANRPEIPSVAAVCVYPSLVGVAHDALRGTGVAVASVATGFPAGQTSLAVKVEETREAVAAGAAEIDMVISREAYLAGDDARVAHEIAAVKEACGDAHLKVILETAELPTYAHVRHASQLAIDAGADVIKTSTGKASSGATPGVVLVMLETVRDHYARTGQVIGVKAAGGVSTTKAALHMLVLVKETLGDEWLTPDRFRIGASSLLNDLLLQYAKLDGGHYGRAEDFSKE
jgi:deoxyribose-phosphate aldolase